MSAIIVATAVVQVPAQGGRVQSVQVEPGLECHAIQGAKAWVGGGQFERHHKGAPAVGAAGSAEGVDEGEEAFVFAAFGGAHAVARQVALLPRAAKHHPLCGCVDEAAFIEGRLRAERVGLDDAEVEQHLAHVRRFERRQRQVVRSGGKAQLAVAAAGRVALRFRPRHHQHVGDAVLGELPGSGEARDAGAGDQHLGVERFGRFRQRVMVAQPVALVASGIHGVRLDALFVPEEAGAARGQRASRQNEFPAPHQRISLVTGSPGASLRRSSAPAPGCSGDSARRRAAACPPGR